MKLCKQTIKRIKEVSDGWNWDNFKDEDSGKYWTVMQALYCKLSWVQDVMTDDELKDIVTDAMTIVEALQREIKI